MPRLTGTELREARRRAEAQAEEEARRLNEKRAAREKREKEARAINDQRLADLKERRAEVTTRHAELDNVVSALYEEVDKLTRKWPIAPVSDRQLVRTNKAVKAVRDFVSVDGDEFVEDIEEFVPAGDMPENRDVTMLLRELKEALTRYHSRHQLYRALTYEDLGDQYVRVENDDEEA